MLRANIFGRKIAILHAKQKNFHVKRQNRQWYISNILLKLKFFCTNLLVSFWIMSSRGKVVLLFLTLFNKLETANKYCNPCITILPTDGYEDSLVGSYRFIWKSH